MSVSGSEITAAETSFDFAPSPSPSMENKPIPPIDFKPNIDSDEVYRICKEDRLLKEDIFPFFYIYILIIEKSSHPFPGRRLDY